MSGQVRSSDSMIAIQFAASNFVALILKLDFASLILFHIDVAVQNVPVRSPRAMLEFRSPRVLLQTCPQSCPKLLASALLRLVVVVLRMTDRVIELL